jgi:hypothetical protein
LTKPFRREKNLAGGTMADEQKNTTRERRRMPQVLISGHFCGDKQQLEDDYRSAIAGTDITLVRYLEEARALTDTVIIDFVVLYIDMDADDKKARKLISSASFACPGAMIILIARDGFDAHDARVAAVVRFNPYTLLANEIRKRIPLIKWPDQTTT